MEWSHAGSIAGAAQTVLSRCFIESGSFLPARTGYKVTERGPARRQFDVRWYRRVDDASFRESGGEMNVLIAGGGRTGARLANLLLNQDYKVCVVENRRELL